MQVPSRWTPILALLFLVAGTVDAADKLNEPATGSIESGGAWKADSRVEPGCYLRIGGEIDNPGLRKKAERLAELLGVEPVAPDRAFLVPVPIKREWCGSLYLAKRFNEDGADFAYLLDSLGVQMSPAALKEMSKRLAVGGGKGIPVEVVYRPASGEENPIPPIRDRLRSGQCQVLDYFSIPLFCFNRADGKPDHLGYIVPFLTVTLYTSDDTFWNPLTQESTTAHEFIAESQAKIIDGTVPALIRSNYGGLFQGAPPGFKICGGGDPAHSAHARRIGEQKLVFMCAGSLSQDALERKVVKASVVYHEVNHPVGVHLSRNWTLAQIEGHTDCRYDPVPHEGDIGMTSVYGAQISYQFYLSTHPRLSCEDRQALFWSAKKNMRCKLCKFWKIDGQEQPIPASHKLENSPPQCDGDESRDRSNDPCSWE